MRVHPSNIHPSGSRWQLTLAVVLLLGMLVYQIGFANDNSAVATQAPRPEMRQVVVVSRSLAAGELISEDALSVEPRAITSLPADTIVEIQNAVGKVSLGPIPAGYPLAQTLMQSASDVAEKDPERLADMKLQKVRDTTVAIAIPFKTSSPARGSRIALTVQGATGSTVLVSEEAWVEEAGHGVAQVRVDPHMALYLEEAKNIGSMSFLLIPDEGDSPFKNQAITDIFELRKKLDVKSKPVAAVRARPKPRPKTRQQKKPKTESFSSYAWVTGETVKYAVGDKGKIHVINPNGTVNPLHYYKHQEPDAQAVEQETAESDVDDTRRVETGLEGLYPLAGVEQ